MDDTYAARMRARIASEPLNLNALGGQVSQDCVAGRVSEAMAIVLTEEIETFKAAYAATVQSRGGIVSSLRPRILIPPKTPQILATKLIKRRRQRGFQRVQAKYARIPAPLCETFTSAQVDVLGQLAFQTKDGTAVCDAPVPVIAKRCQVSDRLVQTTLREAKRLGLIAIRYRRRMTSLITILSDSWLAYLKAKTSLSGNKNSSFSSITSVSSKGEEPCGLNPSEPSTSEAAMEPPPIKRPNHPPALVPARLSPLKLKAWIEGLMIDTSRYGGFATDQPMPKRIRNSTSALGSVRTKAPDPSRI